MEEEPKKCRSSFADRLAKIAVHLRKNRRTADRLIGNLPPAVLVKEILCIKGADVMQTEKNARFF